MSPERALLAGAVALSWALSCLHAVRAHGSSPEASAFRPFWWNAYTETGRRHLRQQAAWGALAAVLTTLLLATG